MSDRERRIKDEAYRLWDEAGRPEGRGDEHWYEAERRIAAGEGEPVPPMEKPGSKKGKSVKVVARAAGNSGVAAPVTVANDASKPRLTKGATIDIAPVKPKKAKDAADKPAKEKTAKDKPDKPAKPKSKG